MYWSCAVISTHRWAVLTVPWIGFHHTGPISLCLDLFVLICILCFFCFILHSCCIIVSTVGWTWWDWSLILRTYLPSVLWHCWLGLLTCKNPSPIWPIMFWWDVKPYSISSLDWFVIVIGVHVLRNSVLWCTLTGQRMCNMSCRYCVAAYICSCCVGCLWWRARYFIHSWFRWWYWNFWKC